MPLWNKLNMLEGQMKGSGAVLYSVPVVLGSNTCTRRQEHSLQMTQLSNHAADSDPSCTKSKPSHTQCRTLCFQTNRISVVQCGAM